jgi:excinuclease ABC subunit C
VFSFIGTIQEEVHRYAIAYHRSLRAGTVASALDAIPGVGEARRNALLRRFKSLKAIRLAGVEELAEAVPRSTARAVYDYFHGQEGADT